MRNHGIGAKIARGQAAVALLILLASLVSVASVQLLRVSIVDLYDRTHNELHAIEEIADMLAENRIAEAYLIHSHGARGHDLVARRHRVMDKELLALHEYVRGGPLEGDVAALRQAWIDYQKVQAELIRQAAAGQIDKAHALFAGAVEQRFDRADQLADKLIARVDARAQRREENAGLLSWWASVSVALLCATSLSGILFIFAMGRYRIGLPLAAITGSLTELARGNLSVGVSGGEREDEIGEMVRALEVFRANARELDQAHRATREAQERAEALARHDALTGLPNRRLFVETLERLAQDEETPPFAVLMMDLDRFKPVNDVHGHLAGDQLLCSLAERLEALPFDCAVARLGGDEFAALVPLPNGAADAISACQIIRETVAQPFLVEDTSVEIGAAIGVSLCPENGRDASTLLRSADMAMYQAKSKSARDYCFFEPSMQAEVEQRARFDAELQAAVVAGDIQPNYQPLVCINSNRIVGFEVLARWVHAERGTIMPDDFIPAAEERGLLPDLTYSLLQRACLDAQSWPDDLRLSINMSPSQLRDPMLAPRMLSILRETGISPHRIEVEVTENALVGDLEATKHVLTSLQNLGMSIALDDFGTGYSSLYHLRELRFDKIKVDKSFVQALDVSDEKGKIVRAMIGLSKSLGLTTTAEGVEDTEQWSLLAAWGCDFGQGYLFGHPMPPDQVDEFLGRLCTVAKARPRLGRRSPRRR